MNISNRAKLLLSALQSSKLLVNKSDDDLQVTTYTKIHRLSCRKGFLSALRSNKLLINIFFAKR